MRPLTCLGLFLGLVGFGVIAQPAWADPPTMPDVGKWTDSQKLDDILEKMKALDSVKAELKMLDGTIKELMGLRDKLVLLEDKIKKLESDLNVVLNQVPANQTAIQEQIRKLKQDVEAMRNGTTTPPETRFKPNVPDTDLDRRLQNIEGGLNQIGGLINELRRSTALPLPTQVNAKDGRIVRVLNRAPFPVTVVFDDMPFRVDANGEGQFSPEAGSFTYEVMNSDKARRTINLDRSRQLTLTLNWP